MVLNEFDMALPQQARGVFANPETTKRMYYASNGLISYVRKLIVGAYELSVIEGRNGIDHQLLGQIFVRDIWRDAPRELNPFNPNCVLRPLEKSSEPFEITRPKIRKSARITE